MLVTMNLHDCKGIRVKSCHERLPPTFTTAVRLEIEQHVGSERRTTEITLFDLPIEVIRKLVAALQETPVTIDG